MRKSTLSCSVAILLLLTLALTGCPNGATVQPEGGDKTPSNTSETKTEQIATVSTSGKMGAPQTARDGSTTLTTTDSTGGRYTFTQPAAAAPAASIRSAGSSTGGTWNYTNSQEIKQFEGKYSGDITSIGSGNLNLTVEKAADPSGKMQEVTSPQNFEFKVTGEKFEATIPAVEIRVPVEPAKPETPPANTVELIKTVRKEITHEGGRTENYSIEFYSDNTYRMYFDGKNFLSNPAFHFTTEGIMATGTYEGNPLEDDSVVSIYYKKMNKYNGTNGDSLISLAEKEFERTGKSVSIIHKEEELIDCQHQMQSIKITGNTFSFKN